MILRGFDCCCSIITRIFSIKQRKNMGLKTILMLYGTIMAVGMIYYDVLFSPWHDPSSEQVVCPVHCSVVAEHLHVFVVLSQYRAELAL